jgi:hypothetical protein
VFDSLKKISNERPPRKELDTLMHELLLHPPRSSAILAASLLDDAHTRIILGWEID